MFALRHCALQCTALQKLVPNFSGNEFAYGQQHIVFWLSAIVTAIESASWPLRIQEGIYYLPAAMQRMEQELMCVLLVAKWPIRFCLRRRKAAGARVAG